MATGRTGNKTPNSIIFIGLAALAVIGFTAMYMLVEVMPPLDGDNTFSQIMFMLLMVALGLTVPYWILKLGSREAHKRNRNEEELQLKDIPKYQRQNTKKGRAGTAH